MKHQTMRTAALTILLFCTIPDLPGQNLIHARAGLITFAEGYVLLENLPFQFSAERLEVFESGQLLQTVTGKAEVQLGPGSSLWIGPGSGIRMVRSALHDTVIQVEHGEVFIEIVEKYKNNLLTVRLGNSVVEFKEKGQYGFKRDPNRLYVHRGKAKISMDGKNLTVKKGRVAYLGSPEKIEKFKKIGYDPLEKWAMERSRIVFQPVLLARRMEAARMQMENRRYWQEMQQIRELEQMRMQQEMQMERMRQQQIFR